MASFATLKHLTGELVANHSAQGISEYERYIDTQDRSLELNQNDLYQHLAGKSVLVTGGSGLIGSALMSEMSQYGLRHLDDVVVELHSHIRSWPMQSIFKLTFESAQLWLT